MASTRSRARLVSLAMLAAALLASLAAEPQSAAAASASNACDAVTLNPSSRTVRPGGQVLLEGEACAPSAPVRVELRKKRRWAKVAEGVADSAGRFSVCAKVRAPRGAKVARLRATSGGGTSGATAVRLARTGTSGCAGDGDADPPGYRPPPPEQGNPDCPLSTPGSTIGLTLPSSCTVVASDTVANPDPIPFWGKLDCASASRQQVLGSGGDSHVMGTGSSQGNGAYRRMTVIDGDDVWGERCEAGLNDNQSGPTVFYHEGQRRATFVSIRLPNSWDVNDPDWRTVMQMKQAQPYYDSHMASMFEIQVRSGSWNVISDWSEPLWTAPARTGGWTRFGFDIVYSQNPAVGSITVYVDLNGDGDASDSGERSPTIRRPTLRMEASGGSGYPVAPGGSIPSHLRAGVYENPSYSCPPPTGCYADYDNIQVVKA
jgi:hypothetical protein